MADIEKLISKQALEDATTNLEKGLLKSAEALDKLIEKSKALNSQLEKNGITQKELDKIRKEIAANQKKTASEADKIRKAEEKEILRLANIRKKERAARQKARDKQTKAIIKAREKEAAAAKKAADKEKAALEKTTVAYQKGLLERQKTIKAAKDEVKAEGAASDSLIKKRQELIKATEAYNKMSAAARKEAAPAIKKLSDEIEREEKAIGNATRGVAKYAQGVKNAAKSLFSQLGLISGFALLGNVIKSSIKTFKDFTSAQSSLQSVTGKTEKELEILTAQAKQLGSTTEFTATEVTNLQIELAKLGFTVTEINQSTDGILKFASATGADLSSAAKTAGVALRSFGLDASEMDKVVEKLAVATTKSALSFEDYDTILSTVGPVAKAYGLELEDVLALTGKLKDAGFDASSAATATRNILLNLADANGDLAKALGGSVSSFDEMIDGMVKLDSEGVDLNETLQLTDKRSVAAFNQFLTGAESARELSDELGNLNGELDDMVETKLDNLAGDVKSLSSAWESLVLNAQGGGGAFRAIVKTAKDAVIQFGNLDLVFKRISKFTEDDASRWFEVLQVTGGKLSEGFRDAIESYDQFSTDVIETNRKSVIEELKDIGLSRKEAIVLYDEYIRRRKVLDEQAASDQAEKAESLKTRINQINQELLDDKEEIIDEELEIVDESNETILKQRKDLNAKLRAEDEKSLRDAQRLSDQRLQIKGAETFKQADLDKSLTSFTDNLYETETAKFKANEEEKTRIAEAEETKRKAFKEAAFQAGETVVRGIADSAFDAGAERREQELADIDAKVEAGVLSEAEADRQRKKIQKEQAKADKRKALFDIFLATGIAVAKAGFITPAAIAAGIAGAAQLAVVAAKPLPKFAKGTGGEFSTPDDYIAGEAGEEIKIDRFGNATLVKKATRFTGKQHANNMIIPNAQTKSLLNGNFDKTSFNDQRLLEKLEQIYRKKQVQSPGITEAGFINGSKHVDALRARRNRFIS